MEIKLEDVVVGFTCEECGHEETAGLDALVEIGTPVCIVCDADMSPQDSARIVVED